MKGWICQDNLLSEFLGDVNWGLLGTFSKSWMKVEFAKSVCRRNCRRSQLRFTSNYFRSQEWRLNVLRQFVRRICRRRELRFTWNIFKITNESWYLPRQFVSEFLGDVNWGLLGIFSKSWMKAEFAKWVCRRNCRRSHMRFTSIYFEVKNEGWTC